MGNLFLTGPRQVGKSTALARALAASGRRYAGLASRFSPEAGGRRFLHLLPYEALGTGREPLLYTADSLCARFGERGKEPLPGGFDGCGAALIRRALAGDCELLVLDELGYLEADAADFRAAVLEALADPRPVLGVVREGLGVWAGTDLGAVIPVSRDNRDDVPAQLLALLSQLL